MLLCFIPLTSVSAMGEGKDCLTVLFTGQTTGYLEPCGCTTGQLGGLARRHTVIEQIRRSSGHLLVLENGDLTAGFGEQEKLKVHTILRAMAAMGYDALNLGERDLFMAEQFCATVCSENPTLRMLSANVEGEASVGLSAVPGTAKAGRWPAPHFQREFSVNGTSLTVGVVGVMSEEFAEQVSAVNPQIRIGDPEEALEKTLAALGKVDVVIVLAHAPLAEAETLARRFPRVHVMAAGHDEDIPLPEPKVIGQTWLVNPGARGRHLTRVDFTFDRNGRLAGRQHRVVAIDEQSAPSPRILALLNEYQERLKADNLLARGHRLPAAGGGYMGAAKCGECHREAFQAWQKSRHSAAYQTLGRKGRAFDPECVRCHVTGLRYETGFRDPATTPQLAGVGCEECHGPGSKHVAQPKLARFGPKGKTGRSDSARSRSDPSRRPASGLASSCEACHDPEHSRGFDRATHWARIRHGKANDQ